MKEKVYIIDLGINNIKSVGNAIEHVGFEYKIIKKASDVAKARKLILPGVGSFDKGMSRLQDLDLIDIINAKVNIEKIPILGICLGFQMMTSSSDEGELKGLGWFDCHTSKIEPSKSNNIKVPHMGWNEVIWKKDSRLIEGVMGPPRFYFVHSYVPQAEDDSEILANTHYGSALNIALERDNIVGVQFHPEKSHIFGLKIIENFCKRY